MIKKNIKIFLFSAVVSLLFIPLLYGRTRIKTVEYSFGSYYAGASLAAGITWEPEYITVYFPEAPVNIKNAFLEYEAMGVGRDDIGTFQVYFNQGISVATQIFLSDNTNTYSTGEQVKICGRFNVPDVTSVINGNLNSENYAAGIKVNNTAVSAMSLKLYITYEYDDTKTTQIKTVKFPLYSNRASTVATKVNEIANAGTADFTYNAWIQDEGISVKQQWFEINGVRNGAARNRDNSVYISLGGSLSDEMAFDNGEQGSQDFRFIDHEGSGISVGFSTNTQQTITVYNKKLHQLTNTTINLSGGECVLTYEYLNNSSTKTKTVTYFLGQALTGGATDFVKIVHLKEKVVRVREVYAKIYGSYNEPSAGNIVVDSSISGQSLTLPVSYGHIAGTPLTSGFVFIHSLSENKDAWNVVTDTGAEVVLSISNLYGLGSCGAELIITYDYTDDTAFTNYCQTFAGQTPNGLSTSYNLDFNVWFPYPAGGTATLRTAWLNSKFVQGPDNSGDTFTSYNPNTIIGLNSSSEQPVSHRTQDETWGQRVLYKNHGQVELTPAASVTANYQISTNKANFNGSWSSVYDWVPGPYSPFSLIQYKSDGVTQVSAGGWIGEDEIMFVLKSSSPLSTDSIAVELELRSYEESFTDVYTSSISGVSYTGAPLISTFIVSGLTADTTYHWQVRVKGRGDCSAWQYFPEGAGDVDFDFGIDMSSPTVINNQPGYDPWQRLSGKTYNVYFQDKLSMLENVQYAIYPDTYQAGVPLKPWTDIDSGIDQTDYTTPWLIDFSTCQSGYNYISVRAYDNMGNYSVDDVFYVKKDTITPDIANHMEGGDNQWRKADPGAIYNIEYIDNFSYLDTAQYIVYSATGMDSGDGEIVKDWTDIFTSTNVSSYTENFSIDFSTLRAGANYISVRCWDMAGSTKTLPDAFYVRKDTAAPAYQNNEAGGDIEWRKDISNIYYDIDYFDTGGSLLKDTQYKIVSATGGIIVPWYTYASNISSDSYTSNFQILSSNFQLLTSSFSYVSVKVYDVAGNTTTIPNAFYIKKDTVSPGYQNNEAGGDAAWRKTGRGYDVNFYDNISELSGVSYKAIADGEEVISLTAIPGVGGVEWTAQWDVEFDSLKEETTNYITIEIYDMAGNTTTIENAFYIRKDTTPPVIDNSYQTGDDVWRSTNTGSYKVYFTDTGGSFLDKFEIKVTTGTDGSGILICDWTDIGVNISSVAEYNTEWQIPDAVFDDMHPGKNYVHVKAYDIAGSTSTLTNAFYVKKDTSVPEIILNFSGDDKYRKEPGTEYDVDFKDYESKLSTGYYRVRSSTGGILKDWTEIFASSVTLYETDWQVDFSALREGTTNYVDVKVYDRIGNYSEELELFYIRIDTTAPAINNNEEDGDTKWRKTNDGIYDIDYTDSGGSKLKDAQYKIVSATGAVIADWYSYVIGIDSNSYTADFTIPNSTFSLFTTSCSYVSVKVFDIAGNTTTITDAFYIKKDTISPAYINIEEGGDADWIKQGRSYDVNFYDDISGLNGAKYKAVAYGDDVISYTPVSPEVCGSSYETAWGVAFDSLKEGATNYISIEIYDIAGNTTTMSNAFYVKKDTTIPVINNGESGGDNQWRKTGRGDYNVGFSDYGSGLSKAIWESYYNSNFISSGAISSVSGYVYNIPWGVDFNSLIDEATNWIKVEVYDVATNTKTLENAFKILKDTSPPQVLKYESLGDDTWINGSVFYDIDFKDSGSKLDSAQYKVHKEPLENGATLIPWKNIFSNLNQQNYTDEWDVAFSSLTEGYNYVSIKAWDNLSSTDTVTDAFYVKKDTTAPSITVNQYCYSYPGDPGNVFDVDFQDDTSKLNYAEYTIYDSSGMDGNKIKDWHDIFTSTNVAIYDAEWSIDFGVLLRTPTTNWFSVRVCDYAGNVEISTDAFIVFRSTPGPVVNNKQEKDDTWKTSPGTKYNVDFSSKGAALNYFMTKLCSEPNEGGVVYETWTVIESNINASEYTEDWEIHFSSAREGINYVSVWVYDKDGYESKAQDVFYVKKDTTPPEITNGESGGDDTWRKVNDGSYSVYFTDVVSGSLLDYAQYKIISSTGGLIVNWSTPTALTNLAAHSYTTGWQIEDTHFDLLPPNTNYVSVRVFNEAGLSSTTLNAFYIKKDTVAPSYQNNEAGGDAAWRRSGSSYNVNFYDNISELSGASYKAVADGEEVISLTAIPDVGGVEWTAQWDVEFDSLKEETTNYITIEIYDMAGNTTTIENAFYIRKDTTLPVIDNSYQTGDDVWRSTNTGSYKVYFTDTGGSFLDKFEIKVTTGTDYSGIEICDWTDIGVNISSVAEYNTEWQIPDAVFDDMHPGKNYVHVKAYDIAGSTSTLTNAFYVKKDTSVPEIILNFSGDDKYRKEPGTEYDVDFKDYESKLSTGYYRVRSSTGGILKDWTEIFASSVTLYETDWQVDFSALREGTTNYVDVKVYDRIGNYSEELELFYIRIDTTAPAINNNEEDGDTKWRKTNDGIYDIDYTDSGGSKLKDAQYKIVSATGAVIADWYSYVIGIDSNSYTADFTIPNSTFSLFTTSCSYVSVKVFDIAGNTTTITDAFYIKKDTISPAYINIEEGGDADWIKQGRSYDVNFYDDISGLNGAKYKAVGDGDDVISYTPVSPPVSGSSYETAWGVAFDSLKEGATNYITIEIYDIAGNTTTISDAFYIKKDTTIPQITSNILDGVTTWVNVNNTYYDVDFTDAGGSKLSYFETYVWKDKGQSLGLIDDWRTQVFSINTNSYDQAWQISTGTWNNLIQGKNYVSIKVWDYGGSSTETVDAFYILKDTAFPAIANYEVDGDTNWVNSSQYYNVEFSDLGSWLEGAKYTVYSSSDMKTGTKILVWQDIFTSTCTNYTAPWQVLFSSLTPGYNYISVKAYDHLAQTTTVVDAFFIKKDTSLPYIENLQSGDTTWRRINNEEYNVDFYDVGHSSLSYFQTRVSTLNTGGIYLYGWEDEYSDIDKSSYTANWQLTAEHWSQLKEGVTNYISLRVVDLAGNTSSWANAFYVLKDTTPPVITDDQNGDDQWRCVNDGSYDIKYSDTGGSMLDYAEYKIISATGAVVVDWYTYATGISSDVYTANLTLEQAHFTQICSSYSYVWVRALDVSGSTGTLGNYAFYIKKDTAPPIITDNIIEGDTIWRNINDGFYDMDFSDTLSLVDHVEYRINTATGGVRVNWTTPEALNNLSTNSYTADWQIADSDFNKLLPNSTSYVDIRCYDNAGSTDAALNAFYIRKDTISPAAITDLAGSSGVEGEIQLTWTVSGDDGNIDYLEDALYEIRYTDNPPYTWADADYSIMIKTSTPAGNNESYTLTGLAASTTYHAWIKVRDKTDNCSDVSNSTSCKSGADVTEPAKITDLAAQSGGFQAQINLTWTAPGDNGYINPVSGYIVKYTTYSDFNWGEATDAAWTSVEPAVPAPTGTVHTAIFSNLNVDLTYWWGIKAYDEVLPVPNYSILSNTESCKPAPEGERDAMLIYGEGTSSSHKTKVFSGGSWAIGTGGNAAASTIRWTVIKSNNIQKDEKMAGVLCSTDELYIQIYNGAEDTWINAAGFPVTVSAGLSEQRCFDIAYEQNSGRALVVYNNGTSGQVDYRVWSSSAAAWVDSGTLTIDATEDIHCMRLEPGPGTNEIMLATLDAGNDIEAYRWNGSLFTDGQSMTINATYSQYECFDIAWENQTGRCMVLWGEPANPNDLLCYNIWNGSSWGTKTDIVIGKGEACWVRAASDPGSNKIGYTLVDVNSEWYAGVWDGSAWLTPPTADAGVSAYTTGITDCAWEKDSGKFLIVAADEIDRIDWCYWQSDAWHNSGGIITDLNEATLDNYDFGSNIKWLRLSSDPNVNKMILTVIEDGDSIKTLNWTGSNWSLDKIHSSDSSAFNYECAFLSQDRHDNVPPQLADNQVGYDVWQSTNAGWYDISFSDTGGSKLAYFQTWTNEEEGWVTVQSGMNVNLFTDKWKLLDTTFDSLKEGTNDVYVKVYDGKGNVDNENGTYCFHVWKDTTPPSMTYCQGGDYTYRNSTGMEYNVDFADYSSNLDKLEYAVYSSSDIKGAQIKEWTEVATVSGQETYTDDWEIDFYLLNHGTNNWVSVAVWDIAGSSIVYKDVFVVSKDTRPPDNINDLATETGQTYAQIKLSWTAPGDDGGAVSNTGGKYLVKYSTMAAINNDSWDDATEYTRNWEVSGQPEEEFIVVDLNPDLTYWFAIKTRDKVDDRENNNWSAISNSPAGVMPQAGNLFINEVYAYGSPGNDWLELYNHTDSSIPLTGWRIDYFDGAETNTVWNGSGSISSETFKSTGSLTLDHIVSGMVSLYDPYSNLVSYIKYPVFSCDASMSRIYDGGNYLGIDLSHTKGFANSISTHSVKINEVNYQTDEFIELYNTGSSTVTLTGYSLMNKNKAAFVFTRKILPQSFSAVDFSSVDSTSTEKTYNDCFGSSGLDVDSDYVILENPSGQVVDMVSWQGAENIHYDRNAGLVSYINGAPSGKSGSIGRADTEGKDTDEDSADFINFTAVTPGSRNNSGIQPPANTINYPVSSSVLPRNFKFELKLGTNSSAGNTDTIWLIRTGGTADFHSPHIYRLTDLGFSLADNTSVQISTVTGLNQPDIDGYSLSTGTIYRMLLNSDTSEGSADRIILNNLTYDTSIHSIAVSSITPSFLTANEGIRIGLLRLDIENESPSGYNNIELEKVTVKFDDGATPLTTEQGRNLFDEIYVVLNSTDYNSGVEFQPNKDSYVGFVSSSSFDFISGRQAVPVSNPDTANATVEPGECRIYFVAVKLSSGSAANTFSAIIDGDIDAFIREANSNVTQDFTGVNAVNSGTMQVIEGMKSVWEEVTTSSAPVYSSPYANAGSAEVFMGSDDGKLRALDSSGAEKWTFEALDKIRTNVYGDTPGSDVFIYFADESGNLYKLKDGEDYTQMWKESLPQRVNWVVVRDCVYACGREGKMFKLSKETGGTVGGWTGNLSGSLQGSFPVKDGFGDVFALWVSADNGKVYRLELGNGLNSSSIDTGNINEVFTSPTIETGYCNPQLNTDFLFVGSSTGTVYCRISGNLLDIPDGWKGRTGQYVENDGEFTTGSPIRGGVHRGMWIEEESKRYLYFGNDAGKLYKIDCSSGTLYWSQPFQAEGRITTTPVMLLGHEDWLNIGTGNDYVYFGDSKGYFYAVSAGDGATMRPGYPIYLGSAITTNATYDNNMKRLYFGTEDGRMHAIYLGP